MNPPEYNREPAGENKKAALAAFIILVLVMALISAVVFLSSRDIDLSGISVKDVFSGQLFTGDVKKISGDDIKIEYNPKDHPVFEVYKGYIVKCISDNVKFIDSSGQVVWEKNLPVNNPIVRTNGQELLILDGGSKDFYVLKDKGVKWSGEAENSIINGDISQGGHVSIVHETRGYKGAVTVYNLQGGPYFTRNFADNFIVSAIVDPKGSRVVINKLDTGDVKSNTVFEFTDMLGKPSGEPALVEDSLFPYTVGMNSENTLAVSDSQAVLLDHSGKVKWRAEFLNREIFGFAVLEGEKAVIAVSPEASQSVLSGSGSQILTIDSSGKQEEIYRAGSPIINLASQKDIIAAAELREVQFITGKGKLKSKYTPKADVSQVKFLSDKTAAVITKNSIDIIEFD